jgi:hypothetical protein
VVEGGGGGRWQKGAVAEGWWPAVTEGAAEKEDKVCGVSYNAALSGTQEDP